MLLYSKITKRKHPVHNFTPSGNLKKTKSKIYRAITSRTNINKTLGNPPTSQRGSAEYDLLS